MERQGGGQADRAGADNDDAIIFIRHRNTHFPLAGQDQ